MNLSQTRSLVFAYNAGTLAEPQRSLVANAIEALCSFRPALGDELCKAHLDHAPKEDINWTREHRACEELATLFVTYGLGRKPNRRCIPA